MKKYLAVVLAVAMVLSLAACGKQEAPAASTTPAVAEAPKEFKPTYKTLNIICPFNPGGAVDTYCRLVQKYAPQYTDINIVVTNIAGASGTIGMKEILSHENDGTYMAAFNVGPGWCNTKDRTIPYTDKEFTGVAGLFSASQLLCLPESKNYNDFDSFVAYAKANPGKLSIGVSGTGNIPYFSVNEINRKYGTDIKVVVFDGETNALAEMLGGHISGMVASTVTAVSIINNKQAKPVLIFTDQRESYFADVPCMGEYDFEFIMPSHRSFYMKAGTDERVLKYWSDIIGKMCLENQDFIKEATNAGLLIDYIDYKTDDAELHNVIDASEELLKMYGYK